MKTVFKVSKLCVMTSVFLLLGHSHQAFSAATFVSGLVPDWNQPYRYNTPAGPGPDPVPATVNQWNAWCAPSSAANLAGHWADFAGYAVADTTAFPASTVAWAAGPSWQDYLADGFNRPAPQVMLGPLPAPVTDIGWYMDSNRGYLYDNGLGSMGGWLYGNPKHVGTYLKDLHFGLMLYLNSKSASSGVFWVTGTQGSGFAAGTNSMGKAASIQNAASAFAELVSEISRNHTVILSYRHWNVIQSQTNLPPSGQGTESALGGLYYTWGSTPGPNNAEDEEWNYYDTGLALGHAVTAVGYIPAGDPDDLGPALQLGPTDWVIVHDNWSSTARNVIIPFANAWVANTTAFPKTMTQNECAKWSQPPDCDVGLDVQSWGLGGPQLPFTPVLTVADDWLCDGRPITAIRWWGSYMGWLSKIPSNNVPPAQPRPLGFVLTWRKDIPAGGTNSFSRPGDTIAAITCPLADAGESNAPVGWVTEQNGCVSDLSSSLMQSNTYEHEFSYYVEFPATNVWNEKEGQIYWLSVEAVYQNLPPSNQWGWGTTSVENNWNDDAVQIISGIQTNKLVYPPAGWETATNHPYAGQSVNMAYELLTDVCPRRAKKWNQPPDMVFGQNMESFTISNAQYQITPSLRADDFISDGRRITDIHWWGSYLNYSNSWPDPVQPPTGVASPLGFIMSWHHDLAASAPGNPGGYSIPVDTPIIEIYVPIKDCHEVYYGVVPQFWNGTFEHEFQYYVDLLGQYEPWYETSGTVYWLNIQAVFSNQWYPEPQGGHMGWGWKTTPINHIWNDFSVVKTNQSWAVGRYPPQHYYPNLPCDLAFELTTDEVGVGTNWWTQPIVIKSISGLAAGTTGKAIRSVGDYGAGIQYLQTSTNLMLTNWVDIVAKTNTLPPPYTNTWKDLSAIETSKFYRIQQR